MNDLIAKIGLGTVQFGLNYGISNQIGQPSLEEVKEIIDIASNAGIGMLDTAALYGNSEKILGQVLPADHKFRIVTKTPQFKCLGIGAKEVSKLKRTFEQSLAYLGEDTVHGLMVHNADDLLIPGGELLFKAMQELKNNGFVEKLGVSIYHAEQIDKIINRYGIDLIQVPVSLLDQRLVKSGHLKKLKKLRIEIHARSVFLQGALLMAPKDLPAHFKPVQNHLKQFHADCLAYGVTPLSACLDFVIGMPEITRVIVGVCNKNELREILDATALFKSFFNFSRYSWDDDLILNPGNWGN